MILLKFTIKFLANEKTFEVNVKKEEFYRNTHDIVDIYFRTKSKSEMEMIINTYHNLFCENGTDCFVSNSDGIEFYGKIYIYQVSEYQGKMHISIT